MVQLPEAFAGPDGGGGSGLLALAKSAAARSSASAWARKFLALAAWPPRWLSLACWAASIFWKAATIYSWAVARLPWRWGSMLTTGACMSCAWRMAAATTRATRMSAAVSDFLLGILGHLWARSRIF